jgi:hypothetical protein
LAADIPVEPTRFELIPNPKTAWAFGFIVPPPSPRAYEVIE